MVRLLKKSCRFRLAKVKEGEIEDEDGYSIFEPTLKFEVQGKNVFQEIGVDGVDGVVIMHFIESALTRTQRLVNELARGTKGDYEFGLLGTGVGIRLKRHDGVLDVNLDVDPRYGPIPGTAEGSYTKQVGTISVKDWVEAIVALSRELIELFRLSNPRVYGALRNLELQCQALESWLNSH